MRDSATRRQFLGAAAAATALSTSSTEAEASEVDVEEVCCNVADAEAHRGFRALVGRDPDPEAAIEGFQDAIDRLESELDV